MATPEAIVEPVKVAAKKTTKLKAVDPKAAEPSKPKILVYGKPGVGKTWTSLDFPGCYYIDTEGGADLQHYTDKLKKAGGVYFGPEQGSLDFATIIDQVKALAEEKHEYKTLIIDSISKIFALEIAKEAERLGEKNGFGADKKAAIAYMRKLVSWLTRLDMNVILIAHEKPLWGVDAKGERSEIGVTFDAWDKLEYELHLCLNIFKQGKDHKARVTKTRLTGFPPAEVFPWSYTDFAARYGKDVLETAAKQIVLATPEQLSKLRGLIEIVKLPEGQIEKWHKAGGVEAFEDMDAVKVQAIIDYIINTYVNQGEKK
jgi:DNA polymerase III delta prime subunit